MNDAERLREIADECIQCADISSDAHDDLEAIAARLESRTGDIDENQKLRDALEHGERLKEDVVQLELKLLTTQIDLARLKELLQKADDIIPIIHYWYVRWYMDELEEVMTIIKKEGEE